MTEETKLIRIQRIIARGIGNKLPIRTIAKLVRTEVEMQINEQSKPTKEKRKRKFIIDIKP